MTTSTSSAAGTGLPPSPPILGADSAPASARAALVLSTVGCDWHDGRAPADWRVPLRRV